MGVLRNEVEVLVGIVGGMLWFMRRLVCPRCKGKFTSAHPCPCGLSETYW